MTWSFVMNGGRQGLNAILTLVLAGILGPKAFGVLSMAMAYIVFAMLFLESGLVAAVVQRKDLDDGYLDTAFWMMVMLGVLLTGTSLALAGWWAGVNRLPELEGVIGALAITLPIQALSLIQQAVLQRDMNFRALAIRTNVSVVAGGAVGIGMAVQGYGVWALVGQQITLASVGLVLLWSLSKWRPGLRVSRRSARELLGFSSGVLLAKIGAFANVRGDTILMGLFFGPVTVGLYRLADRVTQTVTSVTTRSVQSVSLPEFSRWQDHPEELRRSLVSCLRTAAIATIPALALLASLATVLTPVIGQEWLPAGTALEILCVGGMVRLFGLLVGPLMQALGRTHTWAGLTWAQAVPGVGFLVLAAIWLQSASETDQAAGIALARMAMNVVVMLPLSLYLMHRFTGLRLAHLMPAIRPAVLAGVLTAGLVLAARSLLPTDALPPAVSLVTLAALGGATAAVAMLALDADLREMALRIWTRLNGPTTDEQSTR